MILRSGLQPSIAIAWFSAVPVALENNRICFTKIHYISPVVVLHYFKHIFLLFSGVWDSDKEKYIMPSL